MKRKIFLSISLVALITITATAFFFTVLSYNEYSSGIEAQISTQTKSLADAYTLSESDEAYTDFLATSDNRITLIASDGTVIFDNQSDASEMDNHLDRPEVAEALKDGKGVATRYSDTLSEQTYYYAMKLSNGSVLRVGYTHNSQLVFIGNAVVRVLIIAAITIVCAIFAASFLTQKIIRPINMLNLDSPLEENPYPELVPLLSRMEHQSRKISKQILKLTEQQKEFDYITESMNEGLVIFGENGYALYTNQSAKKIFNCKTNPESYFDISDDPDFLRIIESALAGTAAKTIFATDGSIYELSATSVKANFKSYAAVLFVVDITERENSEKMRREFSANVSHELKTPLTSIMGYAEIIGNGIASPADIPRFSDKIHDEAARLLALIEDIIRLSRLDESDIAQEFQDVDLDKLSNEILTQLSNKAASRSVELHYSGEKSVISGVKPVLHEMIYNLCDNAIAYNKPNGSVNVTLLDNVLSVTDTGIGIAKEEQERVFERFYRVDKSHSKETGGTGLGLSIVKHGAMLHNAKLVLKSELGKGTTITLIFNGIDKK